MSRLGTYTHEASIEVDVDVDDVIAEIDDDELLEELQRRKGVPKLQSIALEVLLDVATAFHDTHSTGVPLHACPNVLCRDAVQALAGGQKKGA